MSRHLAPAVLVAILLASAVTATVAAGEPAGTPTSESSSPLADQGSNANYRSTITSVTPSVSGLSVQVLEFADRLLLSNHTGRTVTIYGYQGEPYARILPDGTAEQNSRSPATYLNQSFYGNITVPPSANPAAPPRWSVVDRTGAFEWHDHRIHWASPTRPPQVKDAGRRTLIFNWQVPIAVASQRGAIAGQLFWQPNSSSAPIAVILLGAAIVIGGLAFVLLVRRRRRREAGGGSGSSAGAREAW